MINPDYVIGFGIVLAVFGLVGYLWSQRYPDDE